MEEQNNLRRYQKYKSKYIRRRNINEILNIYPFHFIHVTSLENIIDILNDGIIKVGRELPEKNRRMSGRVEEAWNYIFGGISFEDMADTSEVPGFSLILSPRILETHDIAFNKGWHGEITSESMMIDSFNRQGLVDNFQRMRSILKETPVAIEQTVLDGWMTHEILFQKNISLKDNLIGIVLPDHMTNYTKEQFDEINKLAKKYGDVSIIMKK